jgi:hypothetical protein
MTDTIRAALDAARAKVLWCMHVLGPDDLHAARSYDDAQRMVDDLTAHLVARGYIGGDVFILPIVAVWPYSAQQHAAAVEAAAKEARDA